MSSQNKRDIYKVVHNIVGVEYKTCPAAWREVKKRLAEDEDAFMSRLKKMLAKH